MLPIRCASSSFASRLGHLALLLVLGAIVGERAEARPLTPLGIEEFRVLLENKRDARKLGAGKRDERLTAPIPAAVLAEYRRNLRDAVAALPSLGEVTRALLLTEWGTPEYGSEVSGFLRKEIKEIVNPQRGIDSFSWIEEDQFLSFVLFQYKAQELIRRSDEPFNVSWAINAGIKRDARLQLLDRLVKRLRVYMHSGLPADRIAAANLLSETLAKSRRQDLSDLGMRRPSAAPTARNLRERLRDLTGEVQESLRDANLQVQVAALRALSNLEIDSAVLVGDVKPLLLPPSNVVLRRAAAEGLANALDVMYSQWEKSQPQLLLKSVERIFPLAVRGLSDDDVGVRRACLTACYQAARLLDELARDPLSAQAAQDKASKRGGELDELAREPLSPQERRVLFDPVLNVVEANLPAINARARDSVPALRIAACRVLETLALASQRVRSRNDRPSPSPIPDPTVPPAQPPDNKRGASLPTARGARRKSSVRSNSWASDSPQSMPNKTRSVERDEAMSAVTLAPPVVLSDERIILRTASFMAPPSELPAPRSDNPFRGGVDAMIKDLSDPDYRVRLAAVDVLETLGEGAAPAIPALVKALCDSNKFVRWASARTLGRLNPRRADEVVRGLQGLLNDREDPGVRLAAADALREYGPAAKDAVPHLARVINRGDKDYILAILQTLQGIGTDAAPALPNVAWILRDRSQPAAVRIEAAQTLGRFGALAKGQLPVLRDIMVNDSDEEVRAAASAAVLSIDRHQQ